MRVLMVSQSAKVRQRSLAALRVRPDVDVVEASSAPDAHRLLHEHTYEVLVIDGDMRPEGGFSVLYEFRARGELEGVAVPPAIILVAREDDRWLARWAGAAEAYVKPVDPFFLARRVRLLAGETEGTVAPTTPGQTAGEPLAMDEPPELADEAAPDPRPEAPVADPETPVER